MLAFAERHYDAVIDMLDGAVEALNATGDGADHVTAGSLLRARGHLAAMRQLLDMEEELADAKTNAGTLAPKPLRCIK